MAKEQEREGALILTLPDETLLVVLENLTAQWDRQSWCLVCKKFRDLEAVSRKYVGLMRAKILEPVLRRYYHVEHLDLSSCVGVSDVCLATVAKFTSQRLLSIKFNGATGFGTKGLKSLVECTSLQEVDLTYCKQVRDKGVIAISKLQHLQKLELKGCDNVTDAGLTALSNCKELETLGLSLCDCIGDASIQNVATGCLLLRNIDLSHTKVSNKGLAFLALLRNLECLTLEACKHLTDENLKLLESEFTTLQRLNVTRWSTMGSHGLVALIKRSLQVQELNLSYCTLISSSLQKLKMLQVITLDHCSLDTADLSLVGTECRELKDLSLSRCDGVTNIGVVGVVTAHTGLQRLNFTYCRKITDVGLEAIATNCKGLLSLKMEFCTSITAKGLVLIGEFCLSLEDLDLTGSKLNDDGLKSIARCTKLIFFKINSCMDITNAGLVHIGATCKNLLEFECSRSVGVGDEGIAAMASGCRHLKKVVISCCKFITDASLQSLATLKHLQTLELWACKQVTSIGFFHIAASCKHLRELDVGHCSLVGDPGLLAISYGCQNLRKINISNTSVTDVGLLAVASMPCLQAMELGHMNVSIDEVVMAMQRCGSLKHLKLPIELRSILPFWVVVQMHERGTNLLWLAPV